MSLHVPSGSSTLSKRIEAYPSGVWGRASSGSGVYIKTDDGRLLADLVCALGALTVGHAHPAVTHAVLNQLHYGLAYSLPSVLEEQVAERLCAVIPSAEQVRFVKTGSEAVSGAVRIARAATGRDGIAAFRGHYHGWHDWWASTAERHPGVPATAGCNLMLYDTAHEAIMAGFQVPTYAWSDAENFDDRFVRGGFQGSDALPAAILCEPERVEQERPDMLERLVNAARDAGVLVIFDEMLSGGRLALAGAQEKYRVRPDLATYGKAFGGGLPLAFIAGSEDLMRHSWPVSGTFSGDPLALAACKAMLDLYAGEDVIGRLWRNGTVLYEAAVQAVKESGLPCKVEGTVVRFWFKWADGEARRLPMSLLSQLLMKEGVLMHPSVIFASAAGGTGAMSDIAYKLKLCILEMATSYRHRDLKALVGRPYEDSAR